MSADSTHPDLFLSRLDDRNGVIRCRSCVWEQVLPFPIPISEFVQVVDAAEVLHRVQAPECPRRGFSKISSDPGVTMDGR